MKRLSKDNGCDLKYSLVEEPECYYLLVMNAPRKHVMLQRPDEYDNNLKEYYESISNPKVIIKEIKSNECEDIKSILDDVRKLKL